MYTGSSIPILEVCISLYNDKSFAKLSYAFSTFTKVKDFGKELGDKEIPVFGRVGDVASVGQTTMSTMSTLGGLGSEEEQVGSSGDLAYQASEVLGSTTDQGGLYNVTPQTWSYDTNLSVAQNNMNAQNTWNNSLGLPKGFDPYATPGYGFSYEQWLREQMAA